MNLDQLLSYQHLIIAVAISVIISSLTASLKFFKAHEHKVYQAFKPWLPLLLGLISSFIPGAIMADELGLKMLIGVCLGGLSGQVWKIVNTKLKLITGKL